MSMQFFELVKRNLRIYFRDKGAVFFSLLSMVIVIALMLFFLGDMNVENLAENLSYFQGRDAEKDKADAELFVLIWTAGGIISINAVTVTLAVLSSMIKDRANGILNSIYTAPVSRLKISAAYVFSSWTASVIICAITLAIAEIYCIIKGAEPFSAAAHLKLLGMIALNSFTYSSLMYLVAMFAKTEAAWSGLGTVIGTLVGFLGGIYLPIGTLSEGIGNAMKCLPVIYGAAAFRDIMTEDIAAVMFEGVPADFISEYKQAMGIELLVGDNAVSSGMCAVILAVCGIVFLAAGAAVTSRSRHSDR